MAAGGRATRSVAVALLASTVTAGATIAASTVTGSATLLAAAVLSAAAAGTQVLLLRSGRRATRAGPDEHPFAYGRERYFGSFVVAIVASVLGAVFAVDAGIRAVDGPEPIESPEWALGALGAGTLLAALALRAAVRQADAVRGRASWRQLVRNAKAPELPVVLLQDAAALAGLLLGLGALTAAELADDPVWDGIGTLAIGTLLGLLALGVAIVMRSLLIGASAGRKDVETIRAAVEIDPAVRQLIHMRTQHQGPEELLVGMKVELDHTLTFPEVSEVVNRIERNVRRAVPSARQLYIEPDVTDARRAAPTIGEHDPGHDVPEEIRAKQKLDGDRGALGAGIPVEDERS